MFEIFLELTISVGMKSSFNLYHLMHTAQSNQYWGWGDWVAVGIIINISRFSVKLIYLLYFKFSGIHEQ